MSPSRSAAAASNPPEPPEFAGFPRDGFRFLAELERDNSKEFMDAQRARYEESLRTPALAFVRSVRPLLGDVAPQLVVSDARSGGALLRMNRDTRFTTNKRPYHDSIALRFPHSGGDRRSAPYFGLRLTARTVELSAGWRAPGREVLDRVRRAIDAERVAWASARLDATQRAVFGDLGEPELRRVPRDWPRDHPFGGDLRRKSFVLSTELPAEVAHDADFARGAVDAWAAATPLLRFLCGALGLPWQRGDADEMAVLV